MPATQSGQRLSARYILRERLSEGILGETWRALDVEPEREVILKLLRADRVRDPRALESLQAELDAAARLDHPAVAGGYLLERDGERIFLVRDYVEGRDLSTLRAQPWSVVMPVVAQVAEALGAMHAQGVVHRDLKSSNVILRGDGSVCIIDLGAAALDGDAHTPATGSPYSRSPQQLIGEPPAPADDAYAFGVLLYELLGGYPPFYPNVTRERVLEEPAPRLRPVHPAPAGLIDLVMRLLAKDASERSRPLAEVAAELRAFDPAPAETMAAPASTAAGPSPTASIIRPIVRPPEASQQRARAAGRRTSWLAGIGVAVLAAIVVGVFVALPRFAPKPDLAPQAPAATADEAARPAEVDLEALAEEMDRAEQIRGAYNALFDSLQRRQASQWAAASFEAASKLGEEAENQFGAREFAAASETFKSALDQLQAASDAAPGILREQLERGARALEAGQSVPAREAFALALKIDPQNAVAARGSKRAASLDQVVEALRLAGNDERAQQWTSAANRYRQALQLDPDTKAARDGLERVEARIAADAFAAAMSHGLSALAAGRLDDARASFRRAGQIRPGAREVNDGIEQVTLAERRIVVAAHRQNAESLERAERWKEALAEYEAALKLDGSLEFAQQGRERATPRAELARQFGVLLGAPDRLLTPAVRDQARALLEAARRIPAPGPVLRGQVEQLQASLQQVETPVAVALESDNATEILIHRVGALGAFARREVQLHPGHYTVVGTRAGYRDVRRELTVLPGQTPPTVVIRCEEPI